VELRLARPDDAEATRTIYNAEVTGSTVTFDLVPRSLEEQRAWIDARSGAMAVVVAESDKRAPLTLTLPLTDERRYGDTLIRIYGP